MTKFFTETDLIRYVYGETSELENAEIENAALCDSEFNESLNGYKAIYSDLNSIFMNPSERALDKIFKSAIV